MKGVISTGITCPIIKSGDNIVDIVYDSIISNEVIEDGDIIGITESVVARANGMYVSVKDIALYTDKLFSGCAKIALINTIYSRNRFSMILKGIARSAEEIIINMPRYDEVGNPNGINPWTGVDIKKYYADICKEENCKCTILSMESNDAFLKLLKRANKADNVLNCSLHNWDIDITKYEFSCAKTLRDYFPDKTEWGLLGSNKANEELLKLFPSEKISKKVVTELKTLIKSRLDKDVEVMIYGDGCFKDADSGIWEFADPVASPAYTEGLNGSPNEIKLKAFADDKYKDYHGENLDKAIKEEIKNKDINSKNNEMKAQGTTPRRYVNLLASLMDLTSGSGDKGTPIVIIKNYFKNYSHAE